MSNYDYLKNVISSFSGDRRYITFPKIYLELTGEYTLAVFLNQLIYWSDKSRRKDGYFYKKNEEWKEEILLSDYQIRRATKKLKAMGFLETELKKANGTPVTHYKVNMQAITDSILKFLNNGIGSELTFDSKETQSSLESKETLESLTINYNNKLQQMNTNKEDRDTQQKNVFNIYQQYFGELNSLVMDKVGAWIDDFNQNNNGEEIVIKAMKIAVENNANTFNYAEKILKSWAKKNYTSVEEIEEYENKGNKKTSKRQTGNLIKQKMEEAKASEYDKDTGA